MPDSRLFLMPSESCCVFLMALHPCVFCQRNVEKTQSVVWKMAEFVTESSRARSERVREDNG